jgi:hypothetical protein
MKRERSLLFPLLCCFSFQAPVQPVIDLMPTGSITVGEEIVIILTGLA